MTTNIILLFLVVGVPPTFPDWYKPAKFMDDSFECKIKFTTQFGQRTTTQECDLTFRNPDWCAVDYINKDPIAYLLGTQNRLYKLTRDKASKAYRVLSVRDDWDLLGTNDAEFNQYGYLRTGIGAPFAGRRILGTIPLQDLLTNVNYSISDFRETPSEISFSFSGLTHSAYFTSGTITLDKQADLRIKNGATRFDSRANAPTKFYHLTSFENKYPDNFGIIPSSVDQTVRAFAEGKDSVAWSIEWKITSYTARPVKDEEVSPARFGIPELPGQPDEKLQPPAPPGAPWVLYGLIALGLALLAAGVALSRRR